MGFLSRTSCLPVRGAAAAAVTTFAELLQNRRGFAEDRAEALRVWLQLQPVGEQLEIFEGTKDEVEAIIEFAHGK
jgi:hypothetical protein